MTVARTLVARAPGRVNLIGDHTDYNDGLALPMAIDLAVEIRWRVDESSDVLRLRSSLEPEPAAVALGVLGALGAGPARRSEIGRMQPSWARYPAAVVSLAGARQGGAAEITSTVPPASGLSSSAALCVASALLFGGGGSPAAARPDPVSTARLCQAAESLVGVDVGLMDPLVSMAGSAGHAVLVDFATLEWSTVRMPPDAEVVVVHSGEHRDLRDSPYAERRRQCEAAAAELGPLGLADETALGSLRSRLLRRRARHVVSECRRVRQAASALDADDLRRVGALMDESHRSLAEDFQASTPVVDALADRLRSRPGVLGARLTGGGFGGCVVALCRPGALSPDAWPGRAWKVRAADGASVRALP